MKAVSITDRIKYLHCPGESGQENSHGVLILVDADGEPSKVVAIEDQADFKFWYNNFSSVEKTEAVGVPWCYSL